MVTPAARVDQIRAAFPAESLFAEKEWLVTPHSFPINAATHEALLKLGHRLNLFVRACNELYQRSVSGKEPAWIAAVLDHGKPAELVAFARAREFRNDLPLVLRPDLILTDEGFTIAELDNVPGGIGLTAWLNQTYAALGDDVVGGARGMIDGFESIAPRAQILISREAATYRPEMEWLATQIRAHADATHPARSCNVTEAETFSLPPGDRPGSSTIYRFFELFDLPNIPAAAELLPAAQRRQIRITPPIKPFIEEKMWFALFWLRPLREFWRRELGERHFLELQKHIPYTWILDPSPIPHHAVIPGLDINHWRELSDFSQKQRELILKISGFHETAWGSRSVVLGSDTPQIEWRAAVEHALAQFEHHPYILQRFHKGRIVEHPYADPMTGELKTLRGRVRLCPYYFIIGGIAALRGALATICPADKKLLHGMKDAILAPTAVRD